MRGLCVAGDCGFRGSRELARRGARARCGSLGRADRTSRAPPPRPPFLRPPADPAGAARWREPEARGPRLRRPRRRADHRRRRRALGPARHPLAALLRQRVRHPPSRSAGSSRPPSRSSGRRRSRISSTSAPTRRPASSRRSSSTSASVRASASTRSGTISSAPQNHLRMHFSTFGADWIQGAVADKMPIGKEGFFDLRFEGVHRPDFVFYGLGPRTLNSDRTRYGIDKLQVRPVFETTWWKGSRISLEGGVRYVDFRDDACCDDPSLESQIQSGAVARSPGLPRRLHRRLRARRAHRRHARPAAREPDGHAPRARDRARLQRPPRDATTGSATAARSAASSTSTTTAP